MDLVNNNDEQGKSIMNLRKTFAYLMVLGFVGQLQAADFLSADSTDQNTQENMGTPELSSEEKQLSDVGSLFLSAAEIGSSDIEKQRELYLSEKGWDLGISKKNPGGAYFGWGESDILADPKDVDFGQSRVTAFEKAYQEAVGDYIRARERESTSLTIRKFFNDELPAEALENEVSRTDAIMKKTVALAEASLDSLLKKLDVDPATISKASFENKQRLAEDSIRKEIRIDAAQSVSGMRVVKTFSDLRKVGVLVVQSANLRKIAQDIVNGKTVPSAHKVAGMPTVAEQINGAFQDERDLISEFGVRIFTDESGDSAIVSFGQWSPAVTTNDSKMKQRMAIKSAKINAENLADSGITDFVNSTAVLSSRSELGESAVVNRSVTSTTVSEEESLAIGSLTAFSVKQQGKATIQGVSTIKTWAANHPETGHLIVGHIKMWSPSTRMNILKGPIEKQVEAKAEKKPIQNKIRTSVDFENKHSF